MAKNSKESSQYYLTPINNWYLDLWVPRSLAKNDTDKIIIIPPAYHQRPDLLSHEEYGTPKLWWVFSVRNPDILIDPINDFVSGLEIYVPPNILR